MKLTHFFASCLVFSICCAGSADAALSTMKLEFRQRQHRRKAFFWTSLILLANVSHADKSDTNSRIFADNCRIFKPKKLITASQPWLLPSFCLQQMTASHGKLEMRWPAASQAPIRWSTLSKFPQVSAPTEPLHPHAWMEKFSNWVSLRREVKRPNYDGQAVWSLLLLRLPATIPKHGEDIGCEKPFLKTGKACVWKCFSNMDTSNTDMDKKKKQDMETSIVDKSLAHQAPGFVQFHGHRDVVSRHEQM